jgi:hypothetical protein
MPSELGPGDTLGVGVVAARQIGMQFQPAVMELLGAGPDQTLGTRLSRLLGAQGDEVSVEPTDRGERVRLHSWRLTDGLTVDPVAFDVWNGLWEGIAAMEDKRLIVEQRLDDGDDATTWRLVDR